MNFIRTVAAVQRQVESFVFQHHPGIQIPVFRLGSLYCLLFGSGVSEE